LVIVNLRARKEGYPSLEIIRIAREKSFNLIILGAKGVSHIEEL
jgi:hypothetical protein